MTERESQYPFEKNMDWCSKNTSFLTKLYCHGMQKSMKVPRFAKSQSRYAKTGKS